MRPLRFRGLRLEGLNENSGIAAYEIFSDDVVWGDSFDLCRLKGFKATCRLIRHLQEVASFRLGLTLASYRVFC